MTENNDKNGKKDDKVGYKNPPKDSRFKPGQSGNPKGRPKGRTTIELARLSQEALYHCFLEAAQQPVNMIENNEQVRVPLIMALAKDMGTKSLRGDAKTRKEFLAHVEKATKGKDKIVHDMYEQIQDLKERLMHARQNKGSLKCFETMYSWFMTKKNLRDRDGEDQWPYEDGEPETSQDWDLFMDEYEYLKSNRDQVREWPPKYPSTIFQERVLLQYEEFSHRRGMRAKEGIEKWPYLEGEPVDDKDWESFCKYVDNCLSGKPCPPKWSPAQRDDDPKEK